MLCNTLYMVIAIFYQEMEEGVGPGGGGPCLDLLLLYNRMTMFPNSFVL